MENKQAEIAQQFIIVKFAHGTSASTWSHGEHSLAMCELGAVDDFIRAQIHVVIEWNCCRLNERTTLPFGSGFVMQMICDASNAPYCSEFTLRNASEIVRLKCRLVLGIVVGK